MLADLTIIGGGPAGLFGAYYASMRQMSVRIVDSLAVLGGQLSTLYPEKYIYDVPGFPRILAKDLVTRLVEQAMQYGPEVALGQQVSQLEHNPDRGIYTIHASGQAYQTRSILIAAGVGAFAPKPLAIPEATRYEGRGLHYFVSHLETFRDKRVLIIGGGDSAVDWANMLAPIARQLTLIHRRDQFRAHEDSVRRLREGPARLKLFYEIKCVNGNDCIETVTVYDNRTNASETFEVDAVLVNIGFNNSLGPIKNWGLDIDGGQIRVDGTMATNRPGIYAAGDIAIYEGKLKLIATGFAEAAIAVNHARHHLDPSANIFPGHSSNLIK